MSVIRILFADRRGWQVSSLLTAAKNNARIPAVLFRAQDVRTDGHLSSLSPVDTAKRVRNEDAAG